MIREPDRGGVRLPPPRPRGRRPGPARRRPAGPRAGLPAGRGRTAPGSPPAPRGRRARPGTTAPSPPAPPGGPRRRRTPAQVGANTGAPEGVRVLPAVRGRRQPGCRPSSSTELVVSRGPPRSRPARRPAREHEPVDPGAGHRRPAPAAGRRGAGRAPPRDRAPSTSRVQPRPVGDHRPAGRARRRGEGPDGQLGARRSVRVHPAPARRVGGDAGAVREGEEHVGAGRGGQPQPAGQQVVPQDDGAAVVGAGDDLEGVDQAQRGVGDQLAGLHRAVRAEQRRPARPAAENDGVRVGGQCRRAPAGRAQATAVGRPVPRVVGALVAGVPHRRAPAVRPSPCRWPSRSLRNSRPARATVVAVRSGRSSPAVPSSSSAVVDQRRRRGCPAVELHQVQPLAALHPGRVGRRRARGRRSS